MSRLSLPSLPSLTTRREIIKMGAGLAAIIAAGRAPASIVRSMLGARNAMLAVGGAMPYDAAEYLESTGTQWIDTGIPVVNALIGTEVKFQATATTNDRWIFGMYNNAIGNSLNYIIGSYSGWCIGLYNTFYRPGISTDTNVHTVRINLDNGTYFDDVQLINGAVQKTSTTTYNVNAFLFASHRSLNTFSGSILACKMFYCKMYRDGTLVRDFIPVRFTNELGVSEGAMYDRVSGQLFRNQGTGSFVIGPANRSLA